MAEGTVKTHIGRLLAKLRSATGSGWCSSRTRPAWSIIERLVIPEDYTEASRRADVDTTPVFVSPKTEQHERLAMQTSLEATPQLLGSVAMNALTWPDRPVADSSAVPPGSPATRADCSSVLLVGLHVIEPEYDPTWRFVS